ncbi:related to Anaphase-promoting complex subunit 1 [Zygosaccharomyces bailii ISA1307]|nr:related to Anaphase-promoting complex subunit 1 [Zygosaccharomyces bailii ISA1307]
MVTPLLKAAVRNMDSFSPFDQRREDNVDSFSKDYYFSDGNERGDIWLCADRKTVQWYVGEQCIRKFTYDQPVIKANFVDFEKAPNCFVIVLRDFAHVYYLSEGDSTTVCFPFPVSNVFWYSQGLVLERKVDQTLCGELDHRFITLSDPMLPFGFLGLSSHQKHTDDFRNVQMLLFPELDTQKITVLYDSLHKQLNFYYTQLLTEHSGAHNDGTISRRDHHSLGSAASFALGSNTGGSSGNSAEAKKNLRKISILNRRATSATLTTSDNSELPSASLKSAESISSSSKVIPRRSLSATLDRMSGALASPTVEFSSNSVQQNHSDVLHQAISTKDVTLTKISSMTLPQHLVSRIKTLKCTALNIHNREAIAIFDPCTHFSKIWMIDLLPDVINSLSFKIYGNSPKDMIRLSNLGTTGSITDMCIYQSNHFPGTLAILHEAGHISLYNPFFELASPQISLPNGCACERLYYISDDRMVLGEKANISANFQLTLFPYPKRASIKLCFEAIKWICSSSVFQAIVYLWQFCLQLQNDTKIGCEFLALESVLTAMILPPASTGTTANSTPPMNEKNSIYQSLHNTSAYIYLSNFGVPYLMPKIIMGLHLIREEMILNVLQRDEVIRLGEFLSFATAIMDWPASWRDYYGSCISTREHPPISGVFAHPLDEPPSVMKSLYSVTENSYAPITPFISYSRLVEMDSRIDHLITPRSFKIIRFYEMTHASDYSNDFLLQVLSKLEITREEISTFPLGILAPLRKMLEIVEEKLCEIDTKLDLSVVSRPDLERCVSTIRQLKHDTEDQIKNLSPYRASLKLCNGNMKMVPKDIYTVLTEVVKSTNRFTLERGMMEENPEMDDFDEGYTLKKNAGLIFSEDRRFYHVLSLLVYYKPRRIQFLPRETEYTKLLRRKKAIARVMSMRTCATGIGFGAVAYATEKPLATQKWIKAPLDFTYIFPDESKVSLEPEELDPARVLWGEFHSGVSSGLRISKKSKGINGSWIAFNKPKELDAQHGGFLLGLGLNGHLKGLEEWHVYNYLSPKKTHVSIGLLLGMSASMRGTMDLKLTKVLSVHIVALLPPGSSDLNINLKVQTAGLIGIGLLYQRSQHRRMSEVLFSQVKSLIIVNEEPISDENYRLAAGLSLGLINLGVGDLIAGENVSANVNALEFSNSFPIGGVGPDEKIINGLLEILKRNHDVEQDWIPENSFVGALMALMLIFLKTGNVAVAESIKSPFKFTPLKVDVRPEIFMYREWAYHMIMWDTIGTDLSFIIPELNHIPDFEVNTDNLPIYYTMAGRVLSVGIKFASTGDQKIRDTLLYLMDRFLPFYQYPGDGKLDFRLAILGINALVNVLSVSASLVMCGTGDLEVFRRTRFLHEIVCGKHSDLFELNQTTKRSDKGKETDSLETEVPSEEPSHYDTVREPETSLNETNIEPEEPLDVTAEADEKADDENQYSKFITTSLSLGFLFLGSGQYALKTSSLDNLSYLILSVLPAYKPDAPLQETKHFWSMAVEPRCLVVRDAETERSISNIPIEITVKLNDSFREEVKELVAPCLLPDVKTIKRLRVKSPLYYPLEIIFDEEVKATEFFRNGTIIYIERRPAKQNKHYNYESISDIQLGLKKRMENLADQSLPGSTSSFADRLFGDFGLTDFTMLELEKEVKSPGNVQNYNLEMLCSDINSGDVTDYQLELWRRRHCGQAQ